DDKINNYKVRIINYSLATSQGIRPVAGVFIEIEGQPYEETSLGDGQYDAFMKALRKIYERIGKELPILTDYKVSIPPGGRTDALVETVISWNYRGMEFRTKGLDADQVASAIKATEKMLNIIENPESNKKFMSSFSDKK
ncbi:MAG TPA: alpha-isopropylmalate synthase regulatory domain-containing protein, partial [Bacteroidales bacterium]|nr:alpha-isopropylmalate synthase regulatory domain-containing protein [Bacteroidales bacterium]